MRKKGFTIIEVMLATVILGILITAASGLFAGFYNSYRNIKAANAVYDEARFIMERIAKEIRRGTVDYEEYYNQGNNEALGGNYCGYSQLFYETGPDNVYGTFDDRSTGVRRADASAPVDKIMQNDLYLINTEGTERVYFKRLTDIDKKTNKTSGKIAMLKLVGKDYGMDHMDHLKSDVSFCPRDSGEGDGLIDTWLCASGFTCATKSTAGCIGPAEVPNEISFVDITPPSLDIVDLKFFIAPKDDPRKAYADADTQIQPHITIKLTARAGAKIAAEVQGKTPNIILESTVSSRAYTEIITKCNIEECNKGSQPKVCPKEGELVDGASVACSQGIYPACTDAVYINQASENIKNLAAGGNSRLTDQRTPRTGLDYADPFTSSYTFYESKTEFGSCDTLGTDTDKKDACKSRRCSDGFDNDSNGKADAEDPICLATLCSNGIKDKDEQCTDIGGMCGRYETTETSCSDSYDNDCQNGADEKDIKCIKSICSNGLKNVFTDTKLSESCIDVGGLCLNTSATSENNEKLCTDGLDNDCNGTADELDKNCKPPICSNKTIDCGLAPSNYMPANYLKGYQDNNCTQKSDNDEQCPGQGGICGSTLMEICDDTGNLDEDCNKLFGRADHYCINFDKLGFFDNLSSVDFLESLEASVEQKLGSLSLKPDKIEGKIYSKKLPVDANCKRIISATISHNVNLNLGEIVYQLSNDNGGNWCGLTTSPCVKASAKEFQPGEVIASGNFSPTATVSFNQTSGNALKWRALITKKNKTDSSPELKDVTISFTCGS